MEDCADNGGGLCPCNKQRLSDTGKPQRSEASGIPDFTVVAVDSDPASSSRCDSEQKIDSLYLCFEGGLHEVSLAY